MKINITKKGPRAQTGVVPYFYTKKGSLRIVLVQTTHSDRWTIPKGGQERNMTPEESAGKEAWEEAGLKGKVGKLLGNYLYKKGSTGVLQHVMLFPMKVKKQEQVFPESHRRVRKNFTPEEALAVCPRSYKHLVKKLIVKQNRSSK